MRDFLRAEWKTIVVVGLLLGGLFAWFFAEQDISRSGRKGAADEGYEPGVALGKLRMGMQESAILALLAEPEERAAAELGLERWVYPSRGLSLFLHDGKLQSARLDLVDHAGMVRSVDSTLGGPDPRRFRGTWSRQAKKLRLPNSQLAAGGENWRRYPGFVVVFGPDDDKTPKALIVTADTSVRWAQAR